MPFDVIYINYHLSWCARPLTHNRYKSFRKLILFNKKIVLTVTSENKTEKREKRKYANERQLDGFWKAHWLTASKIEFNVNNRV